MSTKLTLKIIDTDFADSYILSEEHTCLVCTNIPFRTKELSSLIKHLKLTHKIDFKDYCETFEINLIYDEVKLNAWDHDGSLFGVKFTREQNNENDKTKKSVEKKSTFFKINGEIVKRQKVSGVDSYLRMTKRLKKKKNSTEKISIGGLQKEVLPYIPEIKDDFFLDEIEHKQLIKILSSPGYSVTLLTGDTGLGKTESVEQICARMNQPVLRIKITGNTSVKNIFQDENYDPQQKKLVKIDKGIIKAAEMGAVLLVDEISAASPAVNFIFFEIMENGNIVDFDGIKRNVHPMFKIVFTDNRIGNPNYYRYHGTQEQNAAFINRIRSLIIFNHLKPSTEKRILKMKYPYCTDTFIDNTVEIARMVREENKKGGLEQMMPIRTLQNICYNFEIFENAEEAFYTGFLNSINDEVEKQTINDLCQKKFGEGMFRK